MRWMRSRLTYANAVATLALVVMVGGGAYVANAQLAGTKVIKACVVKKGPSKGDVRITKAACASNEKSVQWNQKGPVGPAGPAGSPDTAAQVLAKVATVDGAGSGLDADSLDGLSNDVWHQVGAGGEPAFSNGWVNANLGADPVGAAFTKDATGVVHIRGQIKSGTVNPNANLSTAFVLPAGYRPSGTVYVSALTTDGNNVITPGWVAVSPGGNVVVGVGNNAFVSLTVSFRTD
jgi:hypothetical protein